MQILGLAGRVVTYTLRLSCIAQDLDREMGELMGAKADLLAEIHHGGLNYLCRGNYSWLANNGLANEGINGGSSDRQSLSIGRPWSTRVTMF